MGNCPTPKSWLRLYSPGPSSTIFIFNFSCFSIGVIEIEREVGLTYDVDGIASLLLGTVISG